MEKQLIALYKDIKEISERLNRSTYPDDIKRLKKRYADLFVSLRSYLDDPDAPLNSLNYCVAEFAAQEMGQIQSKRKREMARVDNNMAMVSYFLPLIREIESLRAKELAQGMADAWNETFPGNHISGMTVEEIKGGFRSSPCFITTAVCRSLDKADNCYELTLLRMFRDTYMTGCKERIDAVKEYYRIAPQIVERIDSCPNSQEVYASVWEQYLKPCIRLIEEGQSAECEAVYSDMVQCLASRFCIEA